MQEVEFLKFVVENLVTNKEAIVIEKKDDELGTLLTLKVDKADMWIIIWKSGNTINALRAILRLLGLKLSKKINLKVVD